MKKIIIGILIVVVVIVVVIISRPDDTSITVEKITQTSVETDVSDNEEDSSSNEKILVNSKITGFTPSIIEGFAGQSISIEVGSQGFHTFTIDELGVDTQTPNGKTDIVFTPERAGTYEFYCTIPGHREAGQTGTLIVK